jgi:hypothetical protein
MSSASLNAEKKVGLFVILVLGDSLMHQLAIPFYIEGCAIALENIEANVGVFDLNGDYPCHMTIYTLQSPLSSWVLEYSVHQKFTWWKDMMASYSQSSWWMIMTHRFMFLK